MSQQQGADSSGAEELAHMDEVDRDPQAHRPGVEDEAQRLEELYGPPDAEGVFRGDGG